MIFKYHNEIVSITEAGETLPELKAIKKLSNYKDIIEYIYFIHDRSSIYHGILLSDRIKIVRVDRFSHLKDEDFSKLNDIAASLIEKLDMLQYTPNERLLEGINKKIGEYLDYWSSVKITSKNHKLVADTINRAEGLLKIKERIDKLVSKEKTEQQRGGGRKSMIEDLS